MIMPLLAVDDIEKSRDFYVEKLGFVNHGTMDFADGRLMMVFLNLGSNSIMLGVPEDGVTSPKGSGVDLYIGLDDDTDIDAYYEQIKSKGASITTEIKDEFYGDRTFSMKDLDGYSLVFYKTIKEVSLEDAQEIINTGAV